MRCPGQDTRYWKPGDIFDVDCPHCGSKVEFFKDEARRRCGACKRTILNPRMNFGCAAYCKYAGECLGEMGPELARERDDLLKDRVAIEVKRRLGDDFRRNPKGLRLIAHGMKVLRFAESIGREEKAALAPLLCAAFLHLLWEGSGGKAGSSSGEEEARHILEGLDARTELVEKTLGLIAAFFSGVPDTTIEGRTFSDAHQLALMEGKETDAVPERSAEPRHEWQTGAGRALAERL